MNHRNYQEWFFTLQDPHSEALNPEQLAELNHHIEGCQICQLLTSSWRDVDSVIKRTPAAVPMPGFTERWRDRLVADRQRAHGRQTLLVLGFCLLAIVLLSGLLAFLAWPWAKSPDLLAWYWISRIFYLITVAAGIRESLDIFVGTLAGVIPWGGWVLLAGFACQLAVLWLVTIRILTKPHKVLA